MIRFSINCLNNDVFVYIMTTKNVNWTYGEFLSDNVPELKAWQCEELVKLMHEQNTLPFIARYRQQKIGNVDVSVLRQCFMLYEKAKYTFFDYDVQMVKRKIDKTVGSAVKSLQEKHKGDEATSTSLIDELKSAKSMEDVNLVKSKCGIYSKLTSYERAIEAGLKEPAIFIMNSGKPVDLLKYISSNFPNKLSVKEGIIDIIAKEIWMQDETQNFIKELLSQKGANVQVEVKRVAKRRSVVNSKDAKMKNSENFAAYFDFCKYLNAIKAHQILAINRGVSCAFLKKMITLPLKWKSQFVTVCQENLRKGKKAISEIERDAIEKCFNEIADKYLCRCLWYSALNNATKVAEMEALECFSRNLKDMLLVKPLKGCSILGIDPGFAAGCKYAMISSTGDVIDTGKIFLRSPSQKEDQVLMKRLCDLMVQTKCENIAIGNGTGSQQAQQLISDLIKSNFFAPLSVKFCIVSEAGSSRYSISKVGCDDLPGLDPIYRSAVSIARRVLDPLSEYIKIDPKHVGIGMYQHDLAKTELTAVRDSVFEECVSFVGVNLNTCSSQLLQHVSGLGKQKAEAIIKHRAKLGQFRNRKQLLQINGIGQHVYKMCCGFLRIYAAELNEQRQIGTLKRKDSKYMDVDALDATSIHPETYEIVDKLLNHLKLDRMDLLRAEARDVVVRFGKNGENLAKFSDNYHIDMDTLNFIISNIEKYGNDDIRDDFNGWTFVESVNTFDSLSVGSILIGTVRNIAPFGAFVDIGVGVDGMLNSNAIGGIPLHINQQVRVSVSKIDEERNRIKQSVSQSVFGAKRFDTSVETVQRVGFDGTAVWGRLNRSDEQPSDRRLTNVEQHSHDGVPLSEKSQHQQRERQVAARQVFGPFEHHFGATLVVQSHLGQPDRLFPVAERLQIATSVQLLVDQAQEPDAVEQTSGGDPIGRDELDRAATAGRRMAVVSGQQASLETVFVVGVGVGGIGGFGQQQFHRRVRLTEQHQRGDVVARLAPTSGAQAQTAAQRSPFDSSELARREQIVETVRQSDRLVRQRFERVLDDGPEIHFPLFAQQLGN
ncbi:S1 RNA-binding domain-containing protein 1 [Trichinella spiralis]|uniref:S1 RNA-binding domain-containing protein 1 n=2 Tax=Trichinella TaxID=6333 RepID=A0A0V1BDV6_TRISP|nr:S1 RNA-binding domain-containing protein 1 [Trichinella spiralis]